MPTGIEWCDETWNPMIGCSGCEVLHCWAKMYAWRHAQNPTMGKNQAKYARLVTDRCGRCGGEGRYLRNLEALSAFTMRKETARVFCLDCHGTGKGPLRWTGKIEYFPERLEDPLRWRKPRRVFVCGMGDPFAEGVDPAYIWDVYKAMSRAPWHTFIILTKRHARMAELVPRIRGTLPDRLEHVIHGTSISDQRTADLRVPEILKVQGRHCLSLEPMLEEIKMRPGWLSHAQGIEEIYLGGQTGPGAPPLHPQWVRDVRDQCAEAKVRFWFKRWSWPAGKPDPGRTLDGRTHDGEVG